MKILFDRKTKPEAYAKIKGDGNHPKITGMVSFFEVYGGTVVSVEVKGLRDDFKMQTDIIIRTRPDIRIMLVICRLFWRITEMYG